MNFYNCIDCLSDQILVMPGFQFLDDGFQAACFIADLTKNMNDHAFDSVIGFILYFP